LGLESLRRNRFDDAGLAVPLTATIESGIE
jgi:hypothetical protein